MREDNDVEIEHIVEQLRQLNIQQFTLLQRLEQLNGGHSNPNPPPPTAPPAPARHVPPTTVVPFTIGDQVRIKNPKVGQPNRGTITKITPKRITVLGKISGQPQYVTRAPHNIVFA